jgi:uncharacterized iron-regulated protein
MVATAKRVRIRHLVFGICLLALGACGILPKGSLEGIDHPLAGRIWDLANQKFIALAELQRQVAGSELVLLGETHDNPVHHRLQLDMLTASLESGLRPTLLMEQFDTDQQSAIDDIRKAGRDPTSLLRSWDAAQYRDLILKAVEMRLPLGATNLPREKLRPVVRDGFSTLPADEVDRLALHATWDDAREAFMRNVIELSHCGKVSAQLREGLVRAQRLRDATLAESALQHLDGSAIFILGRGHARRDVGVPRYIQARRPATRMLSVALVEVNEGMTEPGGYEQDRVGPAPAYDYLWFTPRARRPDPCLAFGK